MFGLFSSMKPAGLDDLIIFFSFLFFVSSARTFVCSRESNDMKIFFVICSFRRERFTQSTCMQQRCQLDELLSIESRPMSDCGRQLTACRLISLKLDHKVHRAKTINFSYLNKLYRHGGFADTARSDDHQLVGLNI